MTQSVLTMGTFDLMHVGHVRLLRACREIAGDFGIVYAAANPDEFVERFKGRRPIIPLAERLEMLRSCRYVDHALVNSGGENAKPVIAEASPAVIVIGSDWENRDYFAQLGVTAEWLLAQRIRIQYVPYTEGVSSTEIRGRLG